MRGGALPMVGWAVLLALLGTLNAIWTGDVIQIATFAAAVLAVVTTASVLGLLSPQALRRGEPTARTDPQAVTQSSAAAVVMALGLGMLTFGLAFGHFPIYFGAGLIVTGVGRLLIEVRAQRRAVRDAEAREDAERRG